MNTCMDELVRFLEAKPRDLSVVVLPDFFLDRLITLKQTPSEFSRTIEDVVHRKGGSIDGVRQVDIRGGNAANVASALAMLGGKVTSIICTNKLGQQLLAHYLGPLGVDLSHVKITETASLTTALEFEKQDGTVNVMLRDLGGLTDFGPRDLSDEDDEAIGKADYVCVFNWAGTRKHGTELARSVFSTAKNCGKGKTFFDTADPTPNKDAIPKLVERVLKSQHVDLLSLNENEAITYAAYLGYKSSSERKTRHLGEQALESARFLSKRLSARIDLHATEFSATFTKQGEIVVPAFRVKPLRATGAGDAWDAGNIFADGNKLSDECRLMLANAVAACYLIDPMGAHPTRKELAKFLKSHV